MNDVAARKHQLLAWVIQREGANEESLSLIPKTPEQENNPGWRMHQEQRAWSLNHARLCLGQNVEKARRWFEEYAFDTAPVIWRDGRKDDKDWDFSGTNLLRTLLQFGKSPALGAKAAANLRRIFTDWKQPRPSQNMDNNCVYRYPAIHTENHDIMCLTIGLFGVLFSGRDVGEHVRQLRRSLSDRFRRGWTEWHSHVYQEHYLNPLLLLAEHAPDPVLMRAASELINVQLAERAALSVRGFLGGPFQRGYDAQIVNDCNDGYLTVMWQAFGLAGEAAGLRTSGTHFASSNFRPHPLVTELSMLPLKTPVACHRGTRDCSQQRNVKPRKTICYWNTPNISMGSMRAVGRAHQPRFFNILFAASPEKSLRTYLFDPEQTSPWEPRKEQGAVVQHENWLISKGKLVEEGGLQATVMDGVRVYQVEKGLCAHVPLSDDLHVFQVSDLDQYPDVSAFVGALTRPELHGNHATGRTTSGAKLQVNLADMALTVDGQPGHAWANQLHAGPWLESEWDSGVVKITIDGKSVTFGGDEILVE